MCNPSFLKKSPTGVRRKQWQVKIIKIYQWKSIPLCEGRLSSPFLSSTSHSFGDGLWCRRHHPWAQVNAQLGGREHNAVFRGEWETKRISKTSCSSVYPSTAGNLKKPKRPTVYAWFSLDRADHRGEWISKNVVFLFYLSVVFFLKFRQIYF